MFWLLKKFVHWLLNIVFPIQCLGCHRYDFWLCANCLNKIKAARVECPQCRQPSQNSQTCPDCRNQTALDRLIVWADYQNPLVQKSIHALKYGFVSGLTGTLGQGLAQQILTSASPLPNNVVLIPVPLHWQRRNERGFNQAELLARSCADTLKLAYLPKALKRIKYTLPQATLSRHNRLTNLVSLFTLQPGLDFSGKIVIIIDDVPVLTPGRFS